MTDQQSLLSITKEQSYNHMKAGEIIAILEEGGYYSTPRVPIKFIDK